MLGSNYLIVGFGKLGEWGLSGSICLVYSNHLKLIDYVCPRHVPSNQSIELYLREASDSSHPKIKCWRHSGYRMIYYLNVTMPKFRMNTQAAYVILCLKFLVSTFKTPIMEPNSPCVENSQLKYPK